jgi:hypothetical protein
VLSYDLIACAASQDPLLPLTTGSYVAVQFSSFDYLPAIIHVASKTHFCRWHTRNENQKSGVKRAFGEASMRRQY